MVIAIYLHYRSMAHDLKELELSALYDLLATYTTQYTQIMRWGRPSDNLKECEQSILEMQTEIDFRKNKADKIVLKNKDLDDGLELVPALA